VEQMIAMRAYYMDTFHQITGCRRPIARETPCPIAPEGDSQTKESY
jgi:hypothetical protein